jgi:hypothetical protein
MYSMLTITFSKAVGVHTAAKVAASLQFNIQMAQADFPLLDYYKQIVNMSFTDPEVKVVSNPGELTGIASSHMLNMTTQITMVKISIHILQ